MFLLQTKQNIPSVDYESYNYPTDIISMETKSDDSPRRVVNSFEDEDNAFDYDDSNIILINTIVDCRELVLICH